MKVRMLVFAVFVAALLVAALPPTPATFAQDGEACSGIVFANGWLSMGDHPMGDDDRSEDDTMENEMSAPSLRGLIYNPGTISDRLVGIEAEGISEVKISQHMMMDGMENHQEITDGVVIEGGAAISLGTDFDGDYHVELVGLMMPTADTEMAAVAVTLVFENAGRLDVQLPLLPEEEAMGSMDMNHDMDGMNHDDDTDGMTDGGDNDHDMDSMAGMDMMGMTDFRRGGSWPYAAILGGNCSGVVFVDTFARQTVVEGGVSAAFGTLINLGSEPVNLIGGSTAVANAIEIHETVMLEDDVMQMRPLMDGITVEGNSSFVLRRGAYHVMLIDVPSPLDADTTFDLTLIYSDGSEVVQSIRVVPLGQ